MEPENLHTKTVSGFGDEWTRFDQSKLSGQEAKRLFEEYFHIFPWESLPAEANGFDLGCGSGRWAAQVAPRVQKLHLIDASEDALEVAKRNLKDSTNCSFHHASVSSIPLPDESMDFAYSLGVLHHVPDTAEGIQSCVKKLKPGAPFLVYLYYRFDNRPWWFKGLWRMTDLLRRTISSMPHGLRYWTSQLAAFFIYWPLARLAKIAEKIGLNVENFPLKSYRNLSFYTMRTDALDRFGTQLEQRFTRKEIKKMLEEAGLEKIRFSESSPFWCAVGLKRFH